MGSLYVSDLDGTLLNEHSVLSPATVRLLNRLIDRHGIRFTVATARTPATVEPLMRDVRTTLPYIVIGGAALWDNAAKCYRHTRPLGDNTVEALARLFQAHALHPFIYRRHGNLLHTHHYGDMSQKEADFVAARRNLPLKKFFLHDPDYSHNPDEALLVFSMNKYERLRAVADDARAAVPCQVMLYHDIFDDTDGYLEITAEGTTKAAAIRRLAEELHADRVVVFGDNRNDLEMMRVATHSVAVGNAFAEVRQAAHEVIGPNTADSVARWIERDVTGNSI